MFHSRTEECRARSALATRGSQRRKYLPCHSHRIRHSSIRGASTTEKHRVIDSRLQTASIRPRRPAIVTYSEPSALLRLSSSYRPSKLLLHHSSSACTCDAAVRLWCEYRKLSVKLHLTPAPAACSMLSIILMS
jgi:hypothetical protein